MKRKVAENNVHKIADFIEEPDGVSDPSEDHEVENQIIAVSIRTIGGILVGMWSELSGIRQELVKMNKSRRK